jgi:hypothetical protein
MRWTRHKLFARCPWMREENEVVVGVGGANAKHAEPNLSVAPSLTARSLSHLSLDHFKTFPLHHPALSLMLSPCSWSTDTLPSRLNPAPPQRMWPPTDKKPPIALSYLTPQSYASPVFLCLTSSLTTFAGGLACSSCIPTLPASQQNRQHPLN